MDGSYFMYSEEVDWCYRIKEGGWKIHYVPHAETIHVGGASTEQVKADMIVELYKSRVVFFRKHYGSFRALLLKLLLAGASIPRLVFFPIQYAFRSNGREDKRKRWVGYWRLLKALPSL
jgi:GT2 family glycosyltransferase